MENIYPTTLLRLCLCHQPARLLLASWLLLAMVDPAFATNKGAETPKEKSAAKEKGRTPDKPLKTRRVSSTPTITALSPTRNQRNAPASTAVGITFSEAMSATTAGSTAMQVFGYRTGKRSGTFSGAGTAVATFAPAKAFKPGEIVSVTTTTAAQNAGGTALAEAHVYTFTTAAATAPANFIANSPLLSTGSQPHGVYPADFDGDGDMDLAVANAGSSYLTVRKNNGDATFTGSVNVALTSSAEAIFAADLDGDGDMDLAAANTGLGNLAVRMNDGTGSFSGGADYPTSATPGSNPFDIAGGDFDGDGDIDLAVTLKAQNTIAIFTNNGSGVFTRSIAVGGSSPHALCAADFDNDGDIDLAITNTTSFLITVKMNDGTGFFSGGSTVSTASNSQSIQAADFDGDGDMDLAAANISSNTVSVRLNDGNGNFSGSTEVAVGTQPYGVYAADLDGDGDMDMATANRGSNDMSVRLNDGTGNFSGTTNITTGGTQAYALQAADFDGDNDLDLAVVNSGSNRCTMFLNKLPTGVNTPPTITTVANQSVCINTSSAALAFTVGDAETAATSLTVTAASSNTTLVPNINLVLGGSGANRTVTITPASGQTGSTTITLTVTDGNAASTSSTLTFTVNAAPVATFAYAGPYCVNGGSNPSPTFSGGGVAGTFTSTAGLTINAITGLITLASSTPGTYTVTNTIAAANGCSVVSATASVTINAAPVATFAYAGPYCVNGGSNPAPTFSGGGLAGTFTSTAGLSINASTGVITLASSTPGTYTVTNTVTQNGCTKSAITSVTINAAPVATFNYTGPYCVNAGTNPGPAFSGGGVAGTFTSTAGLTINAATGVITLSSSSLGTYTVTNTVTQNGCVTSATASITINAAPVATFAYAGPYCVSGSNPSPTFSGGGIAGTFTSTAGLSINATTGVINLATSTPGTYTVTNTVTQNGCTVSATKTVTINTAPVATFSYAGPYCVNGGSNPSPSFSGGGVAGNFTSTAGLTINATTGAITLVSSTPGTYTVTNTIAAANGCSVVSATASVTINAAPVATFSYAGPYCANGGSNPAPTFSGGGIAGTFTSTAGLTINAATGLITLASTTPGTYTVTNTVTQNGCTKSATATVTINAAPVATFAYADPYCVSGSNPSPTFSGGGIAGTFTSTAGLSINATTGVVNLAASTLGTYVVTNTVTQNGCTVSATASVTINAASVATFSYAGPYCVNSGSNPSPTFSGGGVGGTFTSTAGLSINASTGVIDLAASTLGNYIVTNTVTQNGCTTSATASITIIAAPVATFAYAGPYCANGGSNPSPAFSGGGVAGTFTSTAGLSINAATGVITLASSTPGTYTVTNTIAAANGCSAASATASVTINAAPVATFAYAGPYCVSGGSNPSPTFSSGGIAGSFSSTTGLAITTSTGAINLAASTPGTYTVTNTLTAANGCSAVIDTATVTINAAPVATFAYAGPYCVNSGSNPSPTFSGGGVAGTFTSTAGLSINASTGVIDLAASTPGTYAVINTVTQNGCTNSATQSVTISPSISITGTFVNNTDCLSPNGSITLTVTGGTAPLTFDWGTSISAQNRTGLAAGTYTVNVTDASGCNASQSFTLTDPNAPAPFAVTGGGTDCQGGAGFNVGLLGSENGVSYQLLLNGSPLNTPLTGTGSALDFGSQSTVGTYTISAKTVGACTSTMTGNATIAIQPKPSLSIVDPAPACAPATIDLTTLTITDANATTGTLSYWTDAAATSALSNPGAVATSGTYYVRKTTAGGCSDIKPVVVSINATLTANAGSNQSVCAGDAPFTLTGFSPAGGTWSGNGVDASGLFTPSASLIGTQTLTYTIAQNGCSATATKTIIVTTAPGSPTATANSPSVGETLNLTASNVANATYQWSGPNGFTSTQQNPTVPNVTMAAAGTYSVTATINGCTSAAGMVDVVIIPPVLPTSVTVMLDSVAGQSGSSVVVPVRVKDFKNILAAQGSIQWNTAVATFAGVEQFGLPGMTAADFGTTQTVNGSLVFSWSDAALQARTLPDNAIAFAIRFNLVGSTGASSAVTPGNSPTVIEVVGTGNQPIPTTIKAGNISIISVVSVVGQVKSPTGATINGVSLKVSGGPTAPTFTTAADGAFQLNVTGGGSFTVSAFKNNDIVSANGITTLDLILIQRHILGLAPLATPYKLIAADVNQSGTITTLDIVLIRSLILQNTTTFPGNRLWTFVRSDYAFPNPANPFPYDSTHTYTSGGSHSGQDFTGVRLGDVNDTWNSSIARTGTFGEISFRLPDKQVLPDEEITVPVRVGDFSGVSGYQFTLNWNPQVLKFVDVQPGALKGNYGYNRITEGKLTTSWQEANGKSLTLPDDSTVFLVRFKVTGALGSQSTLAINSALTASEAYDAQFQPLSITSATRTISVGERTEPTMFGYELYPSQPNPFSDLTTLRFSVPQPESVNLMIYNSLGQLVKTLGGNYAAGEHQVRWNGDGESEAKLNSGTYFVQMRAGKFVKGRKVVLVE